MVQATIQNNVSPKIIEVAGLKTFLGGHWVHDGLDFFVRQKEIFAIVGGSGSGKSTVLRTLLMLQKPTAGVIKLFGRELSSYTELEIQTLRQSWGMMFQHGALFSSLTVLENVEFPLQEHTTLDANMRREIALLKIELVGLPLSAAEKYPSELSGGMQKRVAIARAIVMDPSLLFLDEPTAGLDPEGANALDELVLNLKENLGLTIVMVTHDLDTLARAVNRMIFLGDGKVLASGNMKELAESQHPKVWAYFNGPRARSVKQLQETD